MLEPGSPPAGPRLAEAPSRPLRRDARENRERILAAARAAFSEQGLEVGVDEIARRAGVGMGTLYRRFPTKDALIDAILADRIDGVVALLEAALEEPDAWRGLETFLVQMVAWQAADRGFKDVLAARRRDEPRLAASRARVLPLLEALIERGRSSGRLRGDLSATDIAPLLWGTGRIVETTVDVAPEFWRRHLALVMAGLRPEAAGEPLPGAALDAAQLSAAMDALACRARGARSGG